VIAGPVITALEQHIIKALPEYVGLLGLLVAAWIANMTPPTMFDLWLGAWKLQPRGDKKFAVWAVIVCWQKFRDLLSMLYTMFYRTLVAFMSLRHPQSGESTNPTKKE
jgi:hypothetical protein